ncbi:hypothetical protein PHMEG_00033887 [Phytophthora megakarya]|uniref:Uncharacterized protein n=1 Tax=Phytophthora megakarya TaxID=4795 RepID=A0A225USJ7_9STRA|nr:hypothetical protein PHMEG_00033887 [Phytophthora megakarya]
MLQGIWNPIHAKQLMQTLMANWEAAEPNDLHVDLKTMRTEALAPAKASYPSLDGQGELDLQLELPHPPHFIKEVLISEHRAMIEEMHEANFNYTLTAVLSASVRLASNAPRAVIFRELFVANTDNRTGHDIMRALQNDVKRLSYDGLHTLRFTFYTKRAAARWLLKAPRFQKAGTGHYNAAQLELQYAIRIYGGGSLGLVALAQAKGLDVEYARASQTEIYDNRYHTIRFAQATCPLSLRGVTRIVLDGTVINIHHFQQNL